MEKTHLINQIFPFISGLTDEQRNDLEANCFVRNFDKGQIIHGGSTDCVGVIGVATGQLRTFLFSPEGKEITLFRLLSSDCCILSASCMLKNIAFDVHVEAEEDSMLLIISPPFFEMLTTQNSQAEKFKNDIISMRFSEVMWLMEQILFMKMDKRIANLLMEKSNLSDSKELDITHQEMADDLGTAREVVSRILKYFENEGILKISRKQIVITNWSKLEEVSMN